MFSKKKRSLFGISFRFFESRRKSWCSLKKKRFSLQISLRFSQFRPKIMVFSKKTLFNCIDLFNLKIIYWILKFRAFKSILKFLPDTEFKLNKDILPHIMYPLKSQNVLLGVHVSGKPWSISCS